MALRLILGLVAAVQLVAADTDGICFDRLGCFSMTSPWRSLLRPFPEPHHPEKIRARFYLYTRKAAVDRYYITTLPEVSVNGSDFDAKRPTVFITHGFANNGNATWLENLKDALLNKDDVNVIVVDWGEGASLFNYLQVASNTRVVGAETARVIRYLLDKKGAKPDLMHLIGHSLGAQISSYTAKQISGIGRITALDPAQPGFEGFDRDVRLDASDAMFVEVIHTDGKPFIPLLGFGMISPVGDVDFYLNGGFDQPGCIIPAEKPEIKSLADLALYPVEVIANFVACPHSRAYEAYTSSLVLNNCVFWGHPYSIVEAGLGAISKGYSHKFTTPSDDDCTIKACSPMGYNTIDYPATGAFLVASTGSKPFCISESRVDRDMARQLVEYKKNKGAASQRPRPIPDVADVLRVPGRIPGKLFG